MDDGESHGDSGDEVSATRTILGLLSAFSGALKSPGVEQCSTQLPAGSSAVRGAPQPSLQSHSTEGFLSSFFSEGAITETLA